MTNRHPDFLLAGYERGGTTLLSELFRANGYESGFETGILLVATPSKLPRLQPYYDMLLPGWNITPKTRENAIKGDVSHFYDTILTAAFPQHEGPYFDKTPKYMECLGTCLNRAPSLKGAVVIHRDPRAVFVSTAKRMSPELPVSEAISKNFSGLVQRYLSYFIGCIAHLESDNVLFVPFEEMVTREASWLKAIGLFVRGKPFDPRMTEARFENVSSHRMETARAVEFDELVPSDLQAEILDATRLASPFIACPLERVRYEGLWAETVDRAERLLRHFELPKVGMTVDNRYFEPLTYLIRYPDVLAAKINPVAHFREWGIRERRNPA